MRAVHQSVSITFRHCCLHSILIFKLSSPMWGRTSINFHRGARLTPHLPPSNSEISMKGKAKYKAKLDKHSKFSLCTFTVHSRICCPWHGFHLNQWHWYHHCSENQCSSIGTCYCRLTHVILVTGRQGHAKGFFSSSPFLIICTLYYSEIFTRISLNQEAGFILESPWSPHGV